ncbi:MAG: NPCBM/NEW2 domain-containing protein [Muribaculum sp.]|nr:NPCBM/NEW2 domain-containing protein [Muribaculum sp.]
MKEQIISAIVGAIIAGLFSLLIFHLGNFSTQESIVESLSVRFDSVDSSMSYEQALEIIYQERATDKKEIESLNTKLNELNTKINEQQNLINQQNSEDEINKIIQNATEYGNSFDYIQALSILNNVKNKTPEIELLINDYSQKYETSIIEKVNNLKEEEKLDDATNLINDALNVLPNSQILKDKLQEIKNSYPQNMVDAIPAYQSGGNTYKEYTSTKSGASEYFTMGGIKYTNGMTFNADINIFDDVSWAVYNLDNKYTSLEFILGHVDGSDLGRETFLEIYYDGQLIEEISVTPDMLPKPVSLDLSGVSQLKMQVRSSGNNGPLYGLGNPVIK